MQRHLRQLAEPRHMALGLLVLAIAAVLIVSARPGTAQAVSAALPPVPHTLDGRDQCLLCHAPGTPLAVPADHAGRTDATCKSCHQATAPQAAPAAPPPGQPAAQPAPASPPANPYPDLPASDAACLACHQKPVKVTLPGGTFDAGIDPKELASSVHGKTVSCTACHADKATGYPHPKITAADRRAYVANAANLCVACHKEVGEAHQDSVHGKALADGKSAAATCVDCHGVHNVTAAARMERKPQLCASCHGSVTQTYQGSVHGQLLASGRTDAATCLDCHSTDKSGHSLSALNDPAGPTADKNVPNTCGSCHKEALKSYSSTFHGRAMRLGVNEYAPNCVDCHGAYGVQPVHSAETTTVEAKFATACAKCHTSADESFVSGWMGHEEPSPAWFPVVFFTERFLFFLTTSVVAFGVVHVELDLLRWLVQRRKDRKGREKK